MSQLIRFKQPHEQVFIYIIFFSLLKLYSKCQGRSPRCICLGSRRSRGTFFSSLGLASTSHGLALLPRSWLGLKGSAFLRLGSSQSTERERPSTEIKIKFKSRKWPRTMNDIDITPNQEGVAMNPFTLSHTI